MQNRARVGHGGLHVQFRMLQEEGDSVGHLYRRLPVRGVLPPTRHRREGGGAGGGGGGGGGGE